jgi:hypothetical protein
MTQFNITNSQVEQLTDSGNNYKLVSDSGNNSIVEKGNVAQASGTENKVQGDPKKEGFWSMLWKKIKSWWK